MCVSKATGWKLRDRAALVFLVYLVVFLASFNCFGKACGHWQEGLSRNVAKVRGMLDAKNVIVGKFSKHDDAYTSALYIPNQFWRNFYGIISDAAFTNYRSHGNWKCVTEKHISVEFPDHDTFAMPRKLKVLGFPQNLRINPAVDMARRCLARINDVADDGHRATNDEKIYRVKRRDEPSTLVHSQGFAREIKTAPRVLRILNHLGILPPRYSRIRDDCEHCDETHAQREGRQNQSPYVSFYDNHMLACWSLSVFVLMLISLWLIYSAVKSETVNLLSITKICLAFMFMVFMALNTH